MIALLIRDLRLAFRAGGGFGLGLAFFLILVVLVPFSVGPQSALLSSIAPGILWLGALLACLLSLDRLLALDFEDGTLDVLATAPLPLEAALAVKGLAHWMTTGLPLVVAAPFLGILLNLPAQGFVWLVVSLVLGTPALSMIGTFGADRGDQTRRAADVAAGAAALCANADLRRGGRAARGHRHASGHTAVPAGGHQPRLGRPAALRRCRRPAHDNPVSTPFPIEPAPTEH